MTGRTWLVFGGQGWIGSKVIEMLKQQGETVYSSACRLEDRNLIEQELQTLKPDFVLNCAGKTGRPNVDWCEDHQEETIRSNVIGCLTLADICSVYGIHVTVFATGCIYEYDDDHPLGSGKGFLETDKPNFTGSFYSKTKAQVEQLLQSYHNVLVLRLRMPISDDLHPRSFITKIISYERVVNVPNSMSILTDLLPIALEMTRRRLTGVYNFTNPGVISHNEILELYKQYIQPDFTWKNFTLEEQSLILKAGRSNNELDVTKLLKEFPELKSAKESIVAVFQRMQSSSTEASADINKNF
jgi:3,5-epimerase/4-reductase